MLDFQLSLGISWKALSPTQGFKYRGIKPDLQMSRLIQCNGGGGGNSWDSIVICKVLRCNCSIFNNVVRLAVQIR